jgi:hypothetical protein
MSVIKFSPQLTVDYYFGGGGGRQWMIILAIRVEQQEQTLSRSDKRWIKKNYPKERQNKSAKILYQIDPTVSSSILLVLQVGNETILWIASERAPKRGYLLGGRPEPAITSFGICSCIKNCKMKTQM